jgi:hypothetical protein
MGGAIAFFFGAIAFLSADCAEQRSNKRSASNYLMRVFEEADNSPTRGTRRFQ